MHGEDIIQEPLFTTVHLDTFIPNDHPLRTIRQLIGEATRRFKRLFNRTYAEGGQQSISPGEPDPRATAASAPYYLESANYPSRSVTTYLVRETDY